MTSTTATVGGVAGRHPWLAPGIAPAIAGLIAFDVYARTLLPGIAFADWGEMQTVPHVLGVAHPTGYPSYVILAWLAQLLPIGSVAFRSNLLSAVLVSGALAVTVAILRRLGVAPLIAVAAGLALGAVRTVWSAATVAEVNPLHLLLVAILLHRGLAWEATGRTRDLVLGALLLGLAAGNHLLILFAAPALVAYVLWVGRRVLLARPWLVLVAAVAGLAGLSVYLYIPIAASQSPPLAYNHPVTLDAVWWLVTGVQFREQFDFLAPGGPQALIDSLPALWSLLVDRATPALPILGGAGLVLLLFRRPTFGLTCAAILTVHAYVWANYLHLEHYLLVPWLVLAIGVGIALDAVAKGIGRLVVVPGLRPRGWVGPGVGVSAQSRAGVAVGLGSLALAIGLCATNWTGADRSGEHGGDTYVEAVLNGLPPDAAILSVWDESTPLWYARFVEGRRPDVLVVDDTNIVYEGWGTRERRIAALVCDRPVFILRLKDRDLDPTRAAFRVEPFLAVRVGQGGPIAAIDRVIYRVAPRDPRDCLRA